LNDGFRSFVTSATADKAASCLSMVGNTTREENGFTYIIGSIRNNCDRKIDHVTIAFKLERPSGSKFNLPDAPILAYANDVQAGETKNFKTTFSIGKNAIYRFDRMTAF